LKIEIKDFIIVSEKRLNIETKEGWDIYFSLEKDIKLQITKLRVLLEKEILIEKRKIWNILMRIEYVSNMNSLLSRFFLISMINSNL